VFGIKGPVHLDEPSDAFPVSRIAQLAHHRFKRLADKDKYLLVPRQAAGGENTAQGVPDRGDDVPPRIDKGAVEVKKRGGVPEDGVRS